MSYSFFMEFLYRLVSIFIIIFSSLSCSDLGLRHTLKHLMTEIIVMPSHIEMVRKDSVLTCSLDSHAKFIVYLDSTDCMSCRIEKLFRYENLYNASEKSPLFDLVILISPKIGSRDEVIRNLQFSVDFPVYLDTENQFLELNRKIPSRDDFHAFLTNEDGKVILVGDPTRSDGMMALFAEALRSLQ